MGRYRGSEPPGGIELSDFALRNHDGLVVRSSDLRGRVTVLTFLDSQCTESCPLIAWTVARALESGQDTLQSAPVRIYNRSGTWIATLHPGADLTESRLAHDIRVALES